MSPRKEKFVAYYRVSTKRQGRSGLGLASQKSMVKLYLKNKYPPNEEFTEVESGGKDSKDRPELEKALKFCKKEKATLVVAKLDRLSRNLHFLTSLEKARIKFVICDMPEATPLTINIMGAIAEWERKAIGERTKSALQEAKKKGVKLGYHNPKVKVALKKRWANIRKNKAKLSKAKPVSSLKKTKPLVPKLSRADVFAKRLKKTFRALKKEGYSTYAMADRLNELGIKTRQNKEWSQTQVVRMQRRLNGKF